MARTVVCYDAGTWDVAGVAPASSPITVTDASLSTSDITTNNATTSKHGFAPKYPNDATKYLDGTGAYTVPAGAGGGIGVDGWVTTSGLSYSSADAPTFVIATSGDLSGTIPVGARIKLTQTTVKYFIVTAISSTTIAVYGGTDYTLANAAITSPSYSVVKSPVGFPVSPLKWQVELADASDRAQSNPVSGTWYNLNAALTISLPVGAWRVYYKASLQAARAAAGSVQAHITLSTANNSESDAALSQVIFTNSVANIIQATFNEKTIAVAAKTSYFLNAKVGVASITDLDIRGDLATTVIRAVCAYL